LQQGVQLGLALGHERGGHVELVRGERGQVEVGIAARVHDHLVDQVIADHQAGDLLEQGLVLGLEEPQLAAHVFDVVFEQ